MIKSMFWEDAYHEFYEVENSSSIAIKSKTANDWNFLIRSIDDLNFFDRDLLRAKLEQHRRTNQFNKELSVILESNEKDN